MAPFKGLLSVFGGFLLHLTLGTGYTFGNMSPYITSYLHVFDVSPNVTATDVIWIYSMVMFGQGLLMSLGGVLDNKAGPRITTYIGSILASAGVAYSYVAIKDSLLMIIMTYGFIFGLGIGIAYTAPLATAMKWFPEHKGLVNGIIVGGFGLGAFIFTQVQTSYLNPHNSLPDETGYFTDVEMLERIPRVFLLLSLIYVSIQLVGCSLLFQPESSDSKIDNYTEDIDKSNYGTVEQTTSFTSDKDGTKSSGQQISTKEEKKEDLAPLLPRKCYTPRQMLRHRQFYILWLTFFFNNQTVIYINGMYKAYGQTFIKDDQYLAMVGAVSALFNSFGRVMWGWFLDRTNYKICMMTVTVGVCIFVVTLGVTPYGGRWMYAAWVWLIFFFISGSYSLLPTCTTLTFGITHAGINYGLVFSNTVVTAPLAAILTQNLSSVLGWYGVFGMLATFSAISFFITLFFEELKDTK